MSSEMKFSDFVRTEFVNLDLREVLQSPPSILLGISYEAASAIKILNIFTVFDLGSSSVFGNASKLVESAQNTRDVFTRYGKAPSDIVDISVKDKKVTELYSESLEILAGIGAAGADALAKTLSVRTVRDLALWPPYLAAKRLVQVSLNPEGIPDFDSEAPADLLPKSGEYPTDTVYYESVVLGAVGTIANPVKLEDAGAIDLLALQVEGFRQPALGAVLTYSQSWYPRAVALGQLLYSLPLAPGENTKVAIIDWTRKTFGRTEQDISQTERLSNTMVQDRAISEIASAVASETQSGDSKVFSGSFSTSGGLARGGFFGTGLGGGAVGFSVGATAAMGYTSSKGKRELSAETQQRIKASTQQNSFSARNRHAAVVSEATQQEREEISTRSVTNYNHMHALSIQYYEVVQLCQTVVRLEKCERCLFIPMRIIDFTNDHTIRRFRSILIDTALDSLTRQQLVYATGSVTANLELPHAYTRIKQFNGQDTEAAVGGPAITGPANDPRAAGQSATQAAARARADARAAAKDVARASAKARAVISSEFSVAKQSGLVLQENDVTERASWEMSTGGSLVNVRWTGNRVTKVTVVGQDGNFIALTNPNHPVTQLPTVHPELLAPKPIAAISRIDLEFFESDDEMQQEVTLVFGVDTSADKSFKFSCDCVLPAKRSRTTLVSFRQPMDTGELSRMLNEQSLYYSRQIWLRSDADLFAMQLASYTYDGKAVVEYIDPVPVAVAGNYLAFRWTDEESQEWKEWQKNHNIDFAKVDIDQVALPTGGEST